MKHLFLLLLALASFIFISCPDLDLTKKIKEKPTEIIEVPGFTPVITGKPAPYVTLKDAEDAFLVIDKAFKEAVKIKETKRKKDAYQSTLNKLEVFKRRVKITVVEKKLSDAHIKQIKKRLHLIEANIERLVKDELHDINNPEGRENTI